MNNKNDNIETAVKDLVANANQSSFIYDLLLAYNQPQATIARLKSGGRNIAKSKDEVFWKKQLFFRKEFRGDLHDLIDSLKSDADIIKHRPRFIIVTDFETLLALDTKTADTLDTSFANLHKHFTFFLPWAGMEKSQFQSENPADIKAAERMGKLYDLIVLDNDIISDTDRHALNLFLSRLLFCFFAEDTGIFDDDQFTNGVASHTSYDGGDLQAYLQKLFTVLSSQQRDHYPAYLQAFPYVNGGLFADESAVPRFSRRSRKLIIESGSLNWKAINPDIFGSMIQAVVNNDQRSNLGMHYTSVVNIMKVIEPLFLNNLREALERAGMSKTKLEALHERLHNIRLFDPACGSGNFLIIAYKELCRLEIEIIKRLNNLNSKVKQGSLFKSATPTQLSFRFTTSKIKLTQFYGIELDDFAHETAKLSLWLAEHQMNTEFKAVFGVTRPTLPLQAGGNIVCGNATRVNWETVCPRDEASETYLFGNPPYRGSSVQDKQQKADVASVFNGTKGCKNLDYIACWLYLGAKYIRHSNAQLGFVSTNSICQGEQVAILWPKIFSMGLEISYAHQSFKWTNNAKNKAGIICIVIGLRQTSSKLKLLFKDNIRQSVDNINPYLTRGKNLIVVKRRSPLSNLPTMSYGNKSADGGHLSLTQAEYDALILRSPEASLFIRPLTGSSEFINAKPRYCLWIEDDKLQEALAVPQIKTRLDAVEDFRLNSKKKATREKAEVPHQFAEARYSHKNSIVIPRVSSERRHYIPMGFLDSNVVVLDSAQVIYDPPPWILAVISSRMHVAWVSAVAGRLKTDYRYSSTLCYNTFPLLEISDTQKDKLEDCVFIVLEEREAHSEKTLAQLYDPDKMPKELREAHHAMDLAVERCYRPQPFESDEERLEYLFKLYEKMIAAEKDAA